MIRVLGGIRATIFAALAGLLLMVAAVQHAEVRHYKAQAVSAKAETVAVKAANVANLATIAKLQAANKAWAGKYAADVAKAVKEARDAIAYAEQQHRAARDAQEALRHAYASHPKAKAWADVVVPESVSRILRQ